MRPLANTRARGSYKLVLIEKFFNSGNDPPPKGLEDIALSDKAASGTSFKVTALLPLDIQVRLCE